MKQQKGAKDRIHLLPPLGFFTLMKIIDKTEDVEGKEHTLVLNEEAKNQDNRSNRVKHTDDMYDKLPKTKKIELKEGHITLCRHFKYLGM